MIFKTPYDTSVTIGYKVNDINNSLVKAIVMGEVEKEGDIYIVSVSNSVLPFNHPFFVKENDVKDLGFAIDARSFFKVGSDGELGVKTRNKGEYDLLLHRAVLNIPWLKEPKTLGYINPKVMMVYSKWITGAISRRFALDPRDIGIIETLCALYYLSLFERVEDWDEFFLDKSLVKITQTMKIPATFIKEMILDLKEPLSNIESLVNLIKSKTENVRLEPLNPAMLIAIVSSSWFGNNHAELLAVALEHPPTFLGLVYSAINETLYKRVGFSQVVQNVLKGDMRNVNTSLYDLIKTHHASFY